MASGPKPSNLQAHADVFVDGQDMTAQWDSRLIELTIIDPENGFNECIIELDDSVSGSWSGGQPSGWLGLPRLGARVQVVLGWQAEGAPTVFQGWVWDIEQSGQRRAGRRLRVECKSGKGTGRVPMTKYWGDDKEKSTGGGGFDDDGVSLKKVLEDAAKAAGYTINVHPSFESIKERYWVQNNESFHQLGWRLAGQYKGLFKVAGGVAGFGPKDGDQNALGQTMPTIQAKVGVNVISWRIKPFVTRASWAQARAAWWDRVKGVMKTEQNDVSASGSAEAWQGIKDAFTTLNPQASDTMALNVSASEGMNSGRDRGSGWIVIDGDPQAQSKGKVDLSGARPGVDGNWKIQQVEHQYSRKSGFITRLDVLSPDITPGEKPSFWNTPSAPSTAAPQAANPPGGT